jgi:hypothetical protein
VTPLNPPTRYDFVPNEEDDPREDWQLRACTDGDYVMHVDYTALHGRYADAVMQLRAIARMGCAEAETDAANDAKDCLRRLGEAVEWKEE